MCMIDGDYDLATVLTERKQKARKSHKCTECFRVINPGEVYLYEFMITNGRPETYKTCEHCNVVRGLIQKHCGGFIYGSLKEDLREHLYPNCDTSMSWYRLYIGMSRKWKRFKSGDLLPVLNVS